MKNSYQKIPSIPVRLHNETFYKFSCHFFIFFAMRQESEYLGYGLWQYGLWSFQTRGTKLERFLPKNVQFWSFLPSSNHYFHKQKKKYNILLFSKNLSTFVSLPRKLNNSKYQNLGGLALFNAIFKILCAILDVSLNFVGPAIP